MLRQLTNRLEKIEFDLGINDSPPLEMYVFGGGFNPSGLKIGDILRHGRVTVHLLGVENTPQTGEIFSPQLSDNN